MLQKIVGIAGQNIIHGTEQHDIKTRKANIRKYVTVLLWEMRYFTVLKTASFTRR